MSDILIVRESGTPDELLVIDGGGQSYRRGILITGNYVHIKNAIVPDITGATDEGSGVSVTGSHCVVEDITIGYRWRGVNVRYGSHNTFRRITSTGCDDGFYLTNGAAYNRFEDCVAIDTALHNAEVRDGHGFGLTDSPHNTLINCHSMNNRATKTDICTFRSPHTVMHRCTSIGSNTQYPILVTIRSDNSVVSHCSSDSVIDIAGTPNVTVIHCAGDITIRDAGPDSDITGLVII